MTNYSAFHCQPEISPVAARPINPKRSTLMKASFQERISSYLPTSSADLFLPYAVLFPDAEVPKDVAEDFVCGNFTNDGAEVVDGFADVLSCKVCREAGGKAFADAEKGSSGVGEGLDMALICDQSGVAVSKNVAL